LQPSKATGPYPQNLDTGWGYAADGSVAAWACWWRSS
jgi:hypothetical protein